MLGRMRPVSPRPVSQALLLSALLASAAPAFAAKVADVQVRGLDPVMTENVKRSLSLVDCDRPRVRAAAWRTWCAKPKRRRARRWNLSATTRRRSRSNARASPDAPVTVTIDVQLGDPVRVRNFDVGIDGEGASDRYLKQEIDAFKPTKGEVFDHAIYEATKARVTRRLAERGYFDADFTARKVEVTRADNAADIALRWNSGIRYDMGEVTFDADAKTHRARRPARQAGVLGRRRVLPPGPAGPPARIADGAGLFLPHRHRAQPEKAVDGQVPVDVTLTPAKRDVYTAGVSYGTDSGAGVRFGLERRYVNDRGHKALAQIDYAQRKKTATVQYRVPAFLWLDGWYTASLQAADEQTEYVDTRRLELVGSRSGEINRYLTAIVSLHALRERWRFPSGNPLDPEVPYQYATLLYPALRAEYIDADDRLYPRRALAGTASVRGGIEGVGSDATFLQLHTTARWIRGLGPDNRLMLRGEYGHTFTNELFQMPLSLRFFAGGDRSMRGYGWREIGPRNGDYAEGAKNVVTGSVEFERYFLPQWGGAAFVDFGDAYDGSTPNLHYGVGIGARWRSPVGPVRVDVARGLTGEEAGWTVSLNIGADL